MSQRTNMSGLGRVVRSFVRSSSGPVKRPDLPPLTYQRAFEPRSFEEIRHVLQVATELIEVDEQWMVDNPDSTWHDARGSERALARRAMHLATASAHAQRALEAKNTLRTELKRVCRELEDLRKTALDVEQNLERALAEYRDLKSLMARAEELDRLANADLGFDATSI